MPPSQTDERRANLIGSLWMIGAMACFAVEDTLVKAAAQAMPLGQLLVLFGLGGAVIFAVVAQLTGTRLISIDVLSRPMRVRVLFEVLGRLFYTLALALTPLSATTVILQATPIVVVAGASVVFGETVGPRRWAAIGIGLLGVMIILNPGADSFSILSLLAVAGMLGFAGRDLASRAAPRSLGIAALGFYGFLALMVAGLLYAIYDGQPIAAMTPAAALPLAGAIVIGTVAYASLMIAMRTGEVSAVTPFRYTRLLFGVACGVVFFDEVLSPATLLGGALIVLSGLVIIWRGRVKAQAIPRA